MVRMSMLVEKKMLRKEVEKLLRDYIGIRLRENEFDPKGEKKLTALDEMAHYDLAVSVALQWSAEADGLDSSRTERPANPSTYPNKMEREAMILSSFAGVLMNSIPLDDILALYYRKPSIIPIHHPAKGHLPAPFSLSFHPFAMLTAPQAVEHARKQSLNFLKSKKGMQKCGRLTRIFSSTSRTVSPAASETSAEEKTQAEENNTDKDKDAMSQDIVKELATWDINSKETSDDINKEVSPNFNKEEFFQHTKKEEMFLEPYKAEFSQDIKKEGADNKKEGETDTYS